MGDLGGGWTNSVRIVVNIFSYLMKVSSDQITLIINDFQNNFSKI